MKKSDSFSSDTIAIPCYVFIAKGQRGIVLEKDLTSALSASQKTRFFDFSVHV